MKALGIAATGMMAQQTNVDVISNNIANANTTGYKTARASFTDLVYENLSREGAVTAEEGNTRPVGLDVGLGVQAVGTVRLNTQGGLVQTQNQLDMAIDGRGYFTVNLPDGDQAYTRDGSFRLSAEGQIVNGSGYEIDPGVVLPANTTKIEISDTGIVSAFVDNDPVPVEIGQLTLATFVNDAGMRPLGDNLLQATVASGDAIPSLPGDEGVGILRQGYLESSNVDIVRQITDLIQAQRAYEMNSKAISTADEMMSAANQIR
ncbi:MAG: flagellar basal-body rod protein FlgG [Marinovum algicola]|jgi:flagellar basal-body rod protein FlgG|uniref:Flagellar basal-body rod protein FlgG n=1 Tax=Marinovum algicola TaxID=42444 RepID=A0A975WCQ3_9RHOB|nr:flagellar basal-body rod protein FlgG [Marinovum algicola]AKO99671.1 Flagellar basal-body rod protein FlgG, Gram-negative bacteria [Marinovum algicola DG 898]SEJ93693.1 flagellar basal-body rod protein FlgG [Marinovum algicola]SLN64690.1 Flagellar basal-body rod protein FlgG [Marinovum algicola]